MNLKDPIFLLSSERSGSNLIRVIFGNHPDFVAPPPIHLLNTFVPLFPCYEDIENEDNFKKLCEDVCLEINTQIGIWEYDFDSEKMAQEIERKNFVGIYNYVYAKEAEASNASRVFIKDNYSFNYFYYLYDNFPGAKFIYLVRDGRDYTVSYMKNPSMFDSMGAIAQQWSSEQRKCLSLYSRFKDSGKILPVHYEDLTKNAETTIREICAFAGIEFHEDMTKFYKKDKNIKDAGSAKAWNNLSKPIKKKNFGKYKRELSPRQIEKIESFAYRELIHCGYRLENDVEKILKMNKRKGFVKKGFQVLKNFSKGKMISPTELKKRKKHFETTNTIVNNLELNAKPILDQPDIY